MTDKIYPHLNNAPIVEAVLDVRVQLPKETTLETVHSVYDYVKDIYSIEQKQFVFSGNFQFEAKEQTLKSSASNTIVNGFLFFSKDTEKKRVCQSRLDGFTFNMQKPYSDWNDFKKEANRLWDIYKSIVKPVAIKRIALRYVNKIEFSLPFTPSKYFATLPVLGTSLQEHDIFNLFTQVSIDNKQINAKATITEGLEPIGINQKMINFVLDIDTYSEGDFQEAEVWEKFNELRDFKNKIFFESITEPTLNLIK